jgi:histidinol-phosphate phosphatase family protein
MSEKITGLIILDRDGTLIKLIPYLADESLVEMLPGVGDNLRNLTALGFEFAIASNQSVVERQLASYSTVEQINKKITDHLAEFGVKISKICFCPHLVESNCDCRKPKPKMGLEIQKSLNFNQNNSLMIRT